MLHLLLTLGSLTPLPAETAAPWAVFAPQETQAPRTSTGTDKEDPHYDEFVKTLRFYENALEGYDFDVRKLRRRNAPLEEYPIPPEYTFYDDFKGLAEKGSVWSMAWLVENLQIRHREEADLVRETKAWHRRMFEEGRDSNAILRPIERLPLTFKKLGMDFIQEEMSKLFENSKHAGVRGNALWAQGRTLVLVAEETGDKQLEEDAHTLYAQLLDGFPQSPLARKAAFALFPSVFRSFDRAVTEWVAAIENHSAAGTPVEEWPERPGAEIKDRMMTLIATPIMQANHWMQTYWVDGEADRETMSLGRALCGDALRLGSLALVSSEDWFQHMFDLFVPLTRTFQSEPWFAEWLADASNQLVRRRIAADSTIAGLEQVLEVVTDPAVRQGYSYVLADACLRTLPKPSLERAEALFRGVNEAFSQPETPAGYATMGEYAATLVERIERVRVGTDASWYSGTTPFGETLQLKDSLGRVLLLDFFSFAGSGTAVDAPKIAALREEFGDSLDVIGLCLDGYQGKLFRGSAKTAGVDWPCISNFRSRGSIWSDWFVTGLPKYMVVGKDGRIVARDLVWDEAEPILRRELADSSGAQTDD